MAKTLKEHLLAELSRKTLGSYVGKAGVDTYRKSKKLGGDEERSNEIGSTLGRDSRTWTHREPVEKTLGVHFSQRNKLEDKIHNRLRGIERASKRLAKEDLDALAEALTLDDLEYLIELYGKGSLEKIRAHHGKEMNFHGDLADVYDKHGRDGGDHMYNASHHEFKGERATELIRQRDSAERLKRAKREHAEAKKRSRDAKRNEI